MFYSLCFTISRVWSSHMMTSSSPISNPFFKKVVRHLDRCEMRAMSTTLMYCSQWLPADLRRQHGAHKWLLPHVQPGRRPHPRGTTPPPSTPSRRPPENGDDVNGHMWMRAWILWLDGDGDASASPPWNVEKHSRTFRNILEHSGIFWNILEHSRTFRNIPKHFETFQNIPKHSRTF